MEAVERTLSHPREGYGAPKDRTPGRTVELGLPAGFEVFSADDHLSLSEDIFWERFPPHRRDDAPRVLRQGGSWVVAIGGKVALPKGFVEVLEQYDPLAGSSSGELDARLAALDAEGIARELAFPNAVLALLHHPDLEVRELCFRAYNEHMASIQEHTAERVVPVGLAAWWDPDATRRTLVELAELGLRTFLLPLNPGRDADGQPIDYASSAADAIWDVIEEVGLPVSHHIGETTPGIPSQRNTLAVGMLQSVAPFREMFAKYTLGGILDRHPGLRIGWFEGGLNWVPSAVQDAEHIRASFAHLANHELSHPIQHYWEAHMCASFMVDPLGLELIDHIGAGRAMWSSDFPHNESTWGYSPQVLASVVAAAGPDRARQILGDNVRQFLGLDCGS